ncbi:LapA family protein [Crocinitomicaceae bacterium]|nr:LapA family protein [Crocinitomicaceae bacterium]MDC1186648.1 LapA family protein [Crocinitomicaceae bacterium]
MIEYWNELSTGQKTKLILKIVVGILALLFAVQNWQSVSFSLVFFRFNIPGTVLILICIGIGFGLASIFDYKKFKVKNKEITELKSKLLSPVDEKKEQ